MKTLYDLVLTASKKYGSKIAIEDDCDFITFNEIYIESLKVSKFLTDKGLKKGDRVSICMGKSIYQILAIIGVAIAGGIFVPILPNLKKDGLKYILDHSGSKFIITDLDRHKEFENLKKKCKVFFYCKPSLLKDNKKNISKLISNYSHKIDLKHKNKPDDDIAIIYSSGSTGYPKGIVIPNKNLELGARIVSQYLKTKKNDRIACVLSFNFDYGLNQLWQCLLVGSTLCLYEIFFYPDFFKFCKRKKITIIPLMPVIISLLTHNISNVNKKFINRNIKYICTSGGIVSKQMILVLRKIFPKAKIYLMYGLTEAFRSSFLDPKKSLRKYYSIGRAIPKVKLNIVREDYSECKQGEVGELVHRGGCVSSRYWKDKVSSRERFKKISRFPREITVFSGDLVKKDKEGDIIFVSRKDFMIKTMGFRVSPTEIESQVFKYKYIFQCVVFSVKDENIGESIILSYTTKNNKKIKNENLKKHLIERLPKYMMPKKFLYFKKFKITGNQGKIDRKEVVEISKNLLKNA